MFYGIIELNLASLFLNATSVNSPTCRLVNFKFTVGVYRGKIATNSPNTYGLYHNRGLLTQKDVIDLTVTFQENLLKCKHSFEPLKAHWLFSVPLYSQ